ncbi:hypothetical protein ABPG72_004389 [Tetrahymena utriculariae]
MSRFNPNNLSQLDLNQIDFQQDTIFSDEESLEDFKVKAKKLIKSAFNTPTRRESKSILHTNKNSSQKSVKFNEVKIEKEGDSLYVSEVSLPQNQSTNPHESISQFNDSRYFPSQQSQNRKQKKLLVTQRDSLLSSQGPLSTRSQSVQSSKSKDFQNCQQPQEFVVNEKASEKYVSSLNSSFEASSYYSMNCKSPSQQKYSLKKRAMSLRSSLCEQEYDIHEFDDPVYCKQKQITERWENAHNQILIQDVLNKYQCNLDSLLKYYKVKQTKNFQDPLFPPCSYSLANRETSYNINRICNIYWKPLHMIIDEKKNITLGQNINSRDVMTNNWHHNNLADILSALAEDKQRIKKLLDQNFYENNEKGCFVVRINCKGVWRYILLDDMVPIFRLSKEPVFCQNKFKALRNIDIWPFMIEKALASYYYCYEKLEHADIGQTLFDLSGAPYEELSLKEEQFTTAAVEKANQINWITMVKAISDDKNIQQLIPIYRLYTIHYVQTKKRVKLLVVELNSRHDNGYLKYCTYIKDNWNIMPPDFQEYALQQAQNQHKVFITYEELTNRFDKLVVSKIYDDYYYVCTRIKQKKLHSASMFKFYLQNSSLFYLQVSQFDKRKMASSYNYLPCRVILSKYESEQQQFVYRQGFYQVGRDISQEFNCEGGEYLVSVLFETTDEQALYEATLSYYGDQKVCFDKLCFSQNQQIFEQQFSSYAKGQIKRKLRLGKAKHIDNSQQYYYQAPTTSQQLEKMVMLDQYTGIVIEVYNNSQLVCLQFAKNMSETYQNQLIYIHNSLQDENKGQEQENSNLKSPFNAKKSNKNNSQIKQFQVLSGQDQTFIYTINNYPYSIISKLKQNLKMYFYTNTEDIKQII